MKEKTDNIQAQLRFLQMEVVRLTNEKVNRDEYVRFLEEENRSVESETREECLVKLEMMGLERDSAIARANRESRRADMEAGKDEIDPNTPYLDESPIADVIKHVMQITDGLPRNNESKPSPEKKDKTPKLPAEKGGEISNEDATRILRSRRQYNASILEYVGIDTSNLPAGCQAYQAQG